MEEEEDGGGGRERGVVVDVAFEVEAGVAGEDVGCFFEHYDRGIALLCGDHGRGVGSSDGSVDRGNSGEEGSIRQQKEKMYLNW